MTETPEFVREDLWTVKCEAEDRAAARGRDLNTLAEDRCTACGRKVNPATVLMVEVNTGGEVILPGDPMSGTENSQGYWEIGPECAKRVLTRDEIKQVRAAARAAATEEV